MLNYVSRMVREREMALDVSQEVFLRAYASLSTYRPEYKFSTWIFRIASNFLIDHWRKKKIVAVSLDQPVENDGDECFLQVADETASVVRELELKELQASLEAAMDRLPAHLRELFVWRHVNGMSYEEMAEIKNIPVGTVKNRVFQAKEMMRVLLEESSCPV
ncbi:MAG: sigma-70 family RNA polymerase sigma factor [Candidatus Aminicenantes bacterium]|nr:sigma-70 family RNA polymerase sigma factor [Candidatus Aminicenantes bacterium]